MPDGSTKTFFTDSSAFSEWSESFDISNVEEGPIDFTVSAQEFFGDSCSFEKRFIYDTIKPVISFVFPKYNNKVSETVPLQVSVEDAGSFKSGFEPIAFLLKKEVLGHHLEQLMKETMVFIQLTGILFLPKNGSRKLKAIVTDLAGNTAEATQTITVINAFEGAVDVNAAIEQTIAAKEYCS